MFMEICSQYYEITIGEGDAAVHFKSRYWVDDNDVYWYSYDDICDSVKLNKNMAKRWYKRDIPEDQKCTCMDSNTDTEYLLPLNYVTSKTAHLVVEQHAAYISERDKNIIKAMDNLEFVGYAYNVYEDANELKEYKQLIYDSIEKDDYQEFCLQCYNVTQTESARDVLDRLGVIDKDLEKALDRIRDYSKEVETILLKDYDDEIILGLNKENDIWCTWFSK